MQLLVFIIDVFATAVAFVAFLGMNDRRHVLDTLQYGSNCSLEQ